ncbi:MAG: FkbM family methyltransferase [Verrucomicrobia bacterium]|nr:FkbM family methyltransferase [Verrucomicrobiota bacterium]
MIREYPPLRRRLKTRLRRFLNATVRMPLHALHGIPVVLLARLPEQTPINLVDVGAHDGDFTFGIACWCGLNKSVMVEPLPHKAAGLRERFRDPHYQVFECALAATPGKAVLLVNEMEATSSLLHLPRELPEVAQLQLGQERRIECTQRTLDSVLAEAGLDRIDLLKIDVQGAEHLVLAGAKATLARTRIVWTECAFKTIYDGASTFSELYTTLNQAGFQLMDLSPAWRGPTGELLQVDALFVRP